MRNATDMKIDQKKPTQEKARARVYYSIVAKIRPHKKWFSSRLSLFYSVCARTWI